MAGSPELQEILDAAATVRASGGRIDRQFALDLSRTGRRRAKRARVATIGLGSLLVVAAIAIVPMFDRSEDPVPATDDVALVRRIESTYGDRTAPFTEAEIAALDGHLRHEHPAVVRAAAQALYRNDAQLGVDQALGILSSFRASAWYPELMHADASPDGALEAELAHDWTRTVKYALRGLWYRIARGDTLESPALIEPYASSRDESVRYLAVEALAATSGYVPPRELVDRLRDDSARIQRAAAPLIQRSQK